jgi:phage N-6-adenine-methyltransferase
MDKGPAGADGSETPQWLFDLINRQVEEITGHGFELDAAASDWNAKCAHYYDEEHDALKQDWSVSRRIWCNPPFSAGLIERFIAKALEAVEKGSTVALLLPNWPGYEWFQEVKKRGAMRDVIGPVKFLHHDGGQAILNNGRNSVGLVVALLGPRFAPGTSGPPIRNPSAPEPPYPPEGIAASRGGQPGVEPMGARFTRLSELEPKETEWLWHLRIPRGEITVIDGDPSVNKSTLLLDLAARVSTGRAMPDGTEGTRGGVLLLMAEDSLRKTVLQRLTAAEADLSRIAVPPRSVVLPRDRALIEELAAQIGATLVIIDPLMAFVTSDSSSDQRVRRALTPLKDLAERTDTAIVLVRHLTKRGGVHALYRGGGSIGIVAAAR